MSPEGNLGDAEKRGFDLLNELAALQPEDNEDLPYDVFCIKLASKSRAVPYSNIVDNEQLRAVIDMGIEAAFRLGRRSTQCNE